jgi:hypothetical protein
MNYIKKKGRVKLFFDIDKRVVRLEAIIEIAEKQAYLPKA